MKVVIYTQIGKFEGEIATKLTVDERKIADAIVAGLGLVGVVYMRKTIARVGGLNPEHDLIVLEREKIIAVAVAIDDIGLTS